MTDTTSPPIVLTIAGSDSGGGAGIQADIKTISATGSYACSVITAITSQNTLGVTAIHNIPTEHIASQLDAVFNDLNIVAVKIGMLASTDIIRCVATKLRQYQPRYIIVDPVMVATSGDLLLQQNAISDLKTQLFPLATLVTPNIPEACVIVGREIIRNSSEMDGIIKQIRSLDINACLIKGGHLDDEKMSQDWLMESDTITTFSAERIPTKNTHGTGCTLSSAIASYLAQGFQLKEAVRKAKYYLSQAIIHADELDIGQGHGPVHHFYYSGPA